MKTTEIVLFTPGGEEFFSILDYDGLSFVPDEDEVVHFRGESPPSEVIARVIERKYFFDKLGGHEVLRLRVEILDATDAVTDLVSRIDRDGADDHFSQCDETQWNT